MNALTKEFFGDGFNVLGFPCNNFNLQEPGANAQEILGGLAWVRPGNGYVPAFQMFKKIDVNGKDEHKLYTYLKIQCGPTSDQFQGLLHYDPKRVSDVRWNFEIFLINKVGVPIYRYSPDHDVMSIAPDIRELINAPIETILRNDSVAGDQKTSIGEVRSEMVEISKKEEADVPKTDVESETKEEPITKHADEEVVPKEAEYPEEDN